MIQRPVAGRILASLGASVAGWALGLIYYLASQLEGRPSRFGDDLDTMAFYTGIFTVAGWCVFFVPLVILVPARNAIYRPAVFPVVGAVLGVVAFAALVAWWAPLWQHWLYAVYPAVVGAGAAATFVWLERRRRRHGR